MRVRKLTKEEKDLIIEIQKQIGEGLEKEELLKKKEKEEREKFLRDMCYSYIKDAIETFKENSPGTPIDDEYAILENINNILDKTQGRLTGMG